MSVAEAKLLQGTAQAEAKAKMAEQLGLCCFFRAQGLGF